MWPSGRQTKNWRAEAQSGGAVALKLPLLQRATIYEEHNKELWETTRSCEELWNEGQEAAGALLEGAFVGTWEGHTSCWRNRRSTRDRSHFKALLWSCASERDATSLAHAHASWRQATPFRSAHSMCLWSEFPFVIPFDSNSSEFHEQRSSISEMSYKIYLCARRYRSPNSP